MRDDSPDVVLDDDPTGVQAVANVPALLELSEERIARAAPGERALHLMTNVRALAPEAAERVTFRAAAAAHRALPMSRIALRGDSTLRGHLLQEYRAVWRAVHRETKPAPVLLLVPALPAAGRITLGGVHWLVDDRGRRALHDTEYARDGLFAYRSSRLLEWAHERTDGLLDAGRGTEVPLADLRRSGGDAVLDAVLEAAASALPAACAPDAETREDLELIARGLRATERHGVRVVVRCAPTFAGVLSGTLAREMAPPPRAGDGGVLIVCGSYVSGTTRQLERLRLDFGVEAIEPDVALLASADGDRSAEASRVSARADRALAADGVALVATPRERPPALRSLDAGERIARGLADVVAGLERLPDVLIAKGGITSQIVVQHGLHAAEARVAGPVAPGVALWRVHARDREVGYLVFPGNVGGPGLLTDVVRLVTRA